MVMAALLAGLVVAHASLSYSFYPSDCCTLVKDDDLAALDWLARTLPSDDILLIPTTTLSDAPFPYPPMNPASDAGAWILPLTGRQTSTLPYSVDFSDALTHARLCMGAVGHIFVGSGPLSFDELTILSRPAWYTVSLELPQTRIYRVTGCSG